MNSFVIDAYAWIEYFDGTKEGEKVKEILENTENIIYTNTITLSELAYDFKKKNYDFTEGLKIIISLSKIYNINEKIAVETGELRFEIKKTKKHISLADTFVLLTARKVNGKVVTGDEDFRGLKEAIMIK